MVFKYLLLIFIFSVNAAAQDTEKLEYSTFSDNIHVSSVDKTLADSIYQFVEDALPFIDFTDCNNCSSRAHIIAAVIEKNFPGVNSAKVWIFADYKRASREKEYRYKPYVYLTYEADCNKWGYHVAPVAIFESENGIDTIVIDHSTQDKPVTLREWADKLVKDEGKGFIVLKDKSYYNFPDNENNRFIDTSMQWVDKETEPLYDNDFAKSLEKVLIARYGFWEPWTYRKHYNEIKQLLE
jgi:hypothetical protein